MNVNLLFADREWGSQSTYYDCAGIVQDLKLDVLFDTAAYGFVMKNGKVMYLEREDEYVSEVIRKVMLCPLVNGADVVYRQTVLKDCLKNEDFIKYLYKISSNVSEQWNQLGKNGKTAGSSETKSGLINDIRAMRMLVSAVSEVRALAPKYKACLTSKGLLALFDGIDKEFSVEYEEQLVKVLDDMTFFVDTQQTKIDSSTYKSFEPMIEVNCTLSDGLKLEMKELEEFKTVERIKLIGMLAKIRGQYNKLVPNRISLYKNEEIYTDVKELEFKLVSYVMASCSSILKSLDHFFEQLRFQTAFYIGGLNLIHHMERYKLDYCFPRVGECDALCFDELKEMVMAIENHGGMIANSGKHDGKKLMIITGANQGGKTTFLKSLGIAKVLMQSGLTVCAKKFESELSSGIFTHFSRREDSAMNSGKLDEELRRMDRIIGHVDKKSLVLMNESFASTTEKEGSEIMEGIVSALHERGIKIYTVTHLLSFAKDMFEKQEKNADSDMAFLCAERLEDGTRTFRMVPHSPELSSFGLELYDQIIGSEG